MSAVAMNVRTDGLADSKFVSLTTFRKNGDPVATPVCHVVYDGKVQLVTLESTWKAKRLRRNLNVRMAPCEMRGTPTGPEIAGVAHILTPDEIDRSPVFKKLRSVGVGFKRSAGSHWMVKPVQLFERLVYRHRFIAIVIDPAETIEVRA